MGGVQSGALALDLLQVLQCDGVFAVELNELGRVAGTGQEQAQSVQAQHVGAGGQWQGCHAGAGVGAQWAAQQDWIVWTA